MQPFIGQLMCVGFNYAPKGWALCQGQLLSISANTALFSLLGTMYGGDGRTTFGLPDLRGRIPLGSGQGPGLQNYSQGEMAGAEQVTLTSTAIPAHGHPVNGAEGEATEPSPANATFSSGGSYASDANARMNAGMIAPSGGGSQPHDNHQPYAVVNWIIATQGLFPSRQ